MNDGLIDAFRHNAWATRELLETLAALSDEQLQTTVPGTFGSIIDTLWHILAAEAGYSTRLTDIEPSFDRRAESTPSLTVLTGYAAEVEDRWERFLAQPFESERDIVVQWLDDAPRYIPAGVILAQALHHSNEHRAQIATALTIIGVQPPEWGVWEYAEASGRIRT